MAVVDEDLHALRLGLEQRLDALTKQVEDLKEHVRFLEGKLEEHKGPWAHEPNVNRHE